MANSQEVTEPAYVLRLPKQLWLWGILLVMAMGMFVFATRPFERARLTLSPLLPSHYAVAAREAVKAGDVAAGRQIMTFSPIQDTDIFPEARLTAQLASVSARLEIQPSAVELLLQKAVALIALRRDDEARETLRTIEKLDPNTPEVRAVLDALYAILPS